jgi:hypothetical protein
MPTAGNIGNNGNNARNPPFSQDEFVTAASDEPVTMPRKLPGIVPLDVEVGRQALPTLSR